MKKAKGNKSLLRLFFINYTFSLIIFIVAIGIFISISIVGLASNLSVTDREIRLMEENFLVEDFDKLDVEGILEVGGWIERLEDNKVVEVIGSKRDNIEEYTVLNVISEYENYDSFGKKYNSRAYLHDSFVYVVKVPNGEYLLNKRLDDKTLGESFRGTIKYSLTVSIGFMVITMCILFCKSIKKVEAPLKKIENGIQTMINGDYTIRLSFKTYKEIDKIRESFNYMVSKLEEAEASKKVAEESKKNMIRDITHDIKTPITSIMGYSRALYDEKVESHEEEKRYLQYIFNKTLRLNYLINELFVFTKLESSEYKVYPKIEEMGNFLREVVALYYGEIEEAEFEFELIIPENEIYCNIDFKELERAVINLMVNSLKYNDKGTTLTIELKEDVEKAVIIIRDDGIGISKELNESVFKEFVRGDSSRQTNGGSGLGLAITKRIVELHNGSISLRSEINKGSEFTIKLPKVK